MDRGEMLCVRFLKLFALESRKYCWVADRVKQVDGVVRGSWKWRRSPRSVEEKQELGQLLVYIQEVSVMGGSDKWEWAVGSEKKFSVQGLKNQMVEVKHGDCFQEFMCSWVPLKVAFVAWRACLDRLPTRENLRKRGMACGSSCCPLYEWDQESADHVIFPCRFSQEVWSLIGDWCRQGPIFAAEIKDLLSIPDYVRGTSRFKKVIRAIFLVTVWCIWRARNECVFNNGRVNVAKIVEEVKILSYLWVDNRNRKGKLDWEQWRAFNILSYV